jgi:hypothetical protein
MNDPKIILDNRLRKIEARLAQVEDQVGITNSITKRQKITLELLAGFSFTLFVILGLKSVRSERS